MKRIVIGIITIVFMVCISMCIYLDRQTKPQTAEKEEVWFTVENEEASINIIPFTRDDKTFVFLPSYADMSRLRIHTDADVYIDNQQVFENESCDRYELNKEYSLRINEHNGDYIIFAKSDNLATMYIDTLSGTMDRIYNDKSYKESASIRVIDPSGNLDCSEDKAKLKGRGNSTWLSAKKPFTLKLDRECELLKLGKNKEWSLLSCGAKMSNIRNKLIYDFARDVGLPSPRCEYVDLYLNGEYNGLYLLTEKITPESEGIDLPHESLMFVRDGYRNDFKTKNNQPVMITYPDKYDDDLKSELMKKVQSMENALMSENGIDDSTGRAYTELIDIESWSKKYLIEEVFGNYDAGSNSQYFYLLNHTDDRIYAGPVWDYDLSVSNGDVVIENPYFFVARRTLLSNNSYSYWYSSLYSKEEYYDFMIKEYQDVFLPKLEYLCNNVVDDTYLKLESSCRMNAQRWQKDENDDLTKDDIKKIKKYLKQHSNFLSSAWIDGVDYCSIAFDDSNRPRQNKFHSFIYYTVNKGDTFSNMPSNEALGVPEDVVWYDKKTDAVVNSQSVITEDMVLYTKPVVQNENTKQPIKTIIIRFIDAAPKMIFGIMLIVFVIIDLKNIRIQRRKK